MSGSFWRIAGVLFTFHFVCFCWIFFRAETLDDAIVIIKQIFTNFNSSSFPLLWQTYATVFYFMGIGFLLHSFPDNWNERLSNRSANWHLGFYIIAFLIFIFICLQVKTSEQVMPIYLQF